MVEKNIQKELKLDWSKPKEPEIEISIQETKIQGLVLFPKIDLSNVKIWNRKLRKWFQVKLEGLTLFPENSEKCKKCGFILKHCQCRKRSYKNDKILRLKIVQKLRIKLSLFISKIFHSERELEKIYLKVLQDYHKSRLEEYYKKYEYHQKKFVKIDNQLNDTKLPGKIL